MAYRYLTTEDGQVLSAEDGALLLTEDALNGVALVRVAQVFVPGAGRHRVFVPGPAAAGLFVAGAAAQQVSEGQAP